MTHDLTTAAAKPTTREEAREAIEYAIGGLQIAGIDLQANDARTLLRNMEQYEPQYAGSALRELADLLEAYSELPADGREGEEDDEPAFIEGGPFPNVDPEFVEMTPDDEASIHGKAA